MSDAKKPEQAGQQDDMLYKKREKIYPREVKGTFAFLRNLAMIVLLGLYYVVAWIQWDGHQILLFDLPARKFYIFGWTFWPQDFFFLALLLMIMAYMLFFFTALAGRLWCGYACPQTVWTEIFIWFERKIEGSRQQQIKRDKAEMSFAKFRVKFLKHFVWIVFSFWTGFTFVGYFTPITELWDSMLNFTLGPWETFWILFYGFATYGNAGWLREQVCIYMCPYARFQSVMFDHDTLIIAYHPERGEPRGARGGRNRKQQEGDAPLGNCIDCKLCVQVCPTGIDIREGLQYQCIGCAACVDVCDEVMEKVGKPKGLIAYTTEAQAMGEKTHIFRPRMLVYSALLLILLGGLAWGIASRVPLEVDIIRDRNTLYNETNEGLVENVYTLKVINMTEKPQTFRISVDGIKGMQLVGNYDAVAVNSGSVKEVPLRVHVDPVELKRRSTEISFTVTSSGEESVSQTQSSRFLGP